ncbi:MAG: flavodoxin family protein [Thermoproteota archaeon]
MVSKSALIVYYSKEGHTALAASEIAKGIASAGVDVSIKKVDDVKSPDEFLKVDAIILGTPTYASNISWPIKRLFDEVLYQIYLRPEVREKIVSGFTSSGTMIDGKRCLKAMNWAFEHSKAKIIEGLVITENLAPQKRRERCINFGQRIARKLMKVR